MKYVREAIESLRKQDFPDYELIFVHSDIFSVDGLSGYLESIHMAHQIISTKSAIGRNGRFKVGVNAAKGAWIAVLDSDDRLYGHALRVTRECLMRSAYTYVFTSGHVSFQGDNQLLEKYPATPMLQTASALSLGFRQRHFWGFINDKSRWPENPFTNVLVSEDYHFFCQCAKVGLPVLHIPFYLYEYRIHQFQSTSVYAEDFNKTTSILRNSMRQFLKKAPPMWHFGDMALATRMIALSARLEKEVQQP